MKVLVALLHYLWGKILLKQQQKEVITTFVTGNDVHVFGVPIWKEPLLCLSTRCILSRS